MAKRNLRQFIASLDDSERDFILVAFAFVLAAIFFLSTGTFSGKEKEIEAPKIYLGYKDVDIDHIELNELQHSACMYAKQYGSCSKLNETFIVSTQLCCKKDGVCC